ncbi:conserved hypothetical protein [Ureaplasma urealyticum serovar 13 str. ATCC 33698]|uniref:SGNH/GDSL hydrolase family protein n=1 Tax=Ureaplasma urealyticum TaxID=2130 RepID=UPI00017220B4|nr:SGNH/GDSL hydrolase family protein [Ureaplasma urealyticum]EDT49613.1 conserved hypothetical protein [Ureaplasma urealyticum serovar 13 str. ATCC 33698]
MDKKSKKILGLSVASIIAAIAIIAPATYFGLQKQEKNKKDINLDNITRRIPGEGKDIIKVEDLNNNEQNAGLKLDFSKVSIKPQTKINYLAIGDSITAGFNSELGWEAPGRYDPVTNKISGLSFPSFIAQYINKVEPNRLASYENLGITGSRITDWLYMLGAGSDAYFKDQEYKFFDFSKQMDQQNKNPFKNRLSKFFKDFGYNSQLLPKNNQEVNASDFNALKEQIKKANLMTISLGANDFLRYLDITKLVNLTNLKGKELETKVKELENTLKKLASEITNDLKKLISLIRNLNPNVSITLISYPLPLLRLQDVIDSSFKLSNKRSLSDEIMSILNNAIKDAHDLNNNVNYIDTFDENDWKENSFTFAKAIFDIHPTELGYKRMAQDIFLKMSLGQNYAQQKTASIANAIYDAWDSEYFNKDKDSFKQQIGFANNTNQDLVGKILGSSKGAAFWAKTALENDQELRKAFSNFKNTSSLVRDWLTSNKRRFGSFVNLITTNLTSLGLDKNGAISQFLSKKDENDTNNLYKLASTLASTPYIDMVVSGIQNDLDNLDFDHNNIIGTQNISKKILYDVFRKNIVNDKNLYELIKGMFNSQLFSENKSQIKGLVKALLSDLVSSHKLLEIIFGEFANDNLKNNNEFLKNLLTIQNKLVQTKSLDNIINVFVDALFDNDNQYLSQGPLSNVLAKIVSANKTLLTTRIDSLFNDLFKDQTMLDATYDILMQVLDQKVPDFIKTPQASKLIKKILSKGTDLKLINTLKLNIVNLLTNSETYAGIFDPSKASIISLVQKSIDFSSKSFISDLLDLLTSYSINLNEWKEFIKGILDSSTITNILNYGIVGLISSNTTSLTTNNFDFNVLLKNLISVLAEKHWTVEQKTKLKSILRASVDELLTNSHTQNFINSIEDFIANKLGDLLLGMNSELLKNNMSDIWKLIKEVVHDLIHSFQSYDLVFTIINNFIDQPENYTKLNSINDLLPLILKSTNKELQSKIDALFKKLVDNQKTTSLIGTLTSNLIVNNLFSKQLSVEYNQKISNFITNILPTIPNLTLYKEVRQQIFEFLTNNVAKILVNPKNSLSILNDGVNQLLSNVLPKLLTIVELVDNDKIQDQDFIDVIKIFIDNLDFNKLFKNNTTNQSTFKINLNLEPKKLIFDLIKNLLNSPVLKVNENQNNKAKIESNKAKIKSILTTSVTNIFENSNIINFFNDQLSQLFSSIDFFKDLNLSVQQRSKFGKAIVEILNKEKLLSNLINKLITNLIDHTNEYAQATSLAEILSLIVKYNEIELKDAFDKLLTNILKNEDLQDLILRILVKLINPNKTYDSISTASISKLKSFITNFATGIGQLDFYQQLKNSIFIVFADKSKMQQLLSNDQSVINEILLEAFNINTPDKVLKISSLLDIKEISARDYADIIEIILVEIGINTNTNVQTNESNNSQESNPNNKSNNFVFQIFKKALNNGISDSQLQKIKDVINYLLDDIVKIHDSSSFLRIQLNQLAHILVDKITTSLPQSVSIKHWYEEIFSSILNNQDFLQKAKVLLSSVLNEIIEHKDKYKNVDSFGQLITTFITNKASDLKAQLKDLLNTVLKNQTLITNIGQVIIESFKLENKIDVLDENLEQNTISFINKIFAHITELPIYNNLVDNFFNFFTQNTNTFDKKPFDFNKFKDSLFNAIIPKMNDFASLLDLFKYNEISEQEWRDAVTFFIDYLPLNSLINSKSSSTNSLALTRNASVSNSEVNWNKIKNIIFDLIKALAQKAKTFDSNVATKTKNIIEFTFDKLLTSNNIRSFAKNLLLDLAPIKSFLNSLNIQDEKQPEVIEHIINALLKDKQLQTIFNALIESILSNSNNFDNTTTLSEIINQIVNTSKEKIKPAITKIIQNLLVDDEIQTLLLCYAIPQINATKTYDNISESSINKIKNLITKLANNLNQFSIYNNVLDNLFTKLGDKTSVDKLLTGDLSSILNILKEVLNLNQPSELIKVIDIFNIEAISAQDYVDVLNVIVNDIGFNNQPTTNNNQNQKNDINVYFNYLKALVEHNFSESAKTKLKEIVKLFVTDVMNDNHEDHFWKTTSSFVSEKLSDLLIKKVQALSTQKNEYRQLINNLLSGNDFKQVVQNLVIEGFAKIINHQEQLKNAQDFGDLIQKIINIDDSWIKNQLKQLLNAIVKNVNLTKATSTAIINSYLNYFEIKNLSEENKNTLINIFDKILKQVPNLSYLQNIVDQSVDFLKTNIQALINNQSLKDDVWNDFINKNVTDISALSNLLEIFKTNEITSSEWNQLITILVDHAPISKIEQIITSLASSSTISNKVQKQSIKVQIDKIYTLIKKVLQSQALNKNHANTSVVKINEVIKTLIDRLFANEEIQILITNKLSNWIFSSNLANTLNIDSNQKDSLIKPIIEFIANSNELKDILKSITNSFVSHASDLANTNSFEELIAKLISLEQANLKNNLKNFVQKLFENKKVDELFARVIFKQVSPQKTYDQIQKAHKDKLIAFIKKIANNLTKFDLYNKLFDNLFNSITKHENLTKLLSEQQDSLISFIKTIFDFSDPKQIVSLIDVLKVSEITSNDYIDVIKLILDEIDFNHFFNQTVENNSSNPSNFQQNSNSSKLDINKYYIYVKTLFAHEMDSTTKEKLKTIINELTKQIVQNTNQGLLNNLGTGLGQKLSNLIINGIPGLTSLKQEYKTLVQKVFTNQNLFEQIQNLIIYAINSLVDHKDEYKNHETFGQLLSAYINKNQTEIISKLKDAINKVISGSSSLIDDIATSFANTIKTYFKLENLSTDDTNKLKGFVDFVIKNIFNLEYVNDGLNKLITALSTNAVKIIDENADFATIMQSDVVSYLTSPQQIAKLFEIVKLDTNDAILNFLKVIFNHLPQDAYANLFGNKINISSNASSNQNTNKSTTPQHNVLDYIKAILNSSYLKEQTTIAKIKHIFKELLTTISKSSQLNNYIGQLISNSFAQKLSDFTNVDKQYSEAFLKGSYQFIIGDEKLIKIIDEVVNDLVDHKDEYLKQIETNNQPSINIILNMLIKRNVDKQKGDFVPFIKRLLTIDSSTQFMAQYIFRTLKLENTNAQDIKVIQTFVKELVSQVDQLDFVNLFIDKIFTLLKENGLDLFTNEEGIKKVNEAMKTFGLTETTNLLKIAKLVEPNKIRAETIGDLINLVFEKSPLAEDFESITQEKNPLYYGLKNLKEDSLSGVLFASGKKKTGEAAKVSEINMLDAIQHLVNKLWTARAEYAKKHPNLEYEQDNPYMRALVHLGIVMQWYVHETYFRNVSGGLWWTGSDSLSGEGRVYLLLKADMGAESEKRVRSMIMGNRGAMLWNTPKEWNYGKNDFLYMITYWKWRTNSRFNDPKEKNKATFVFKALKRGYGQKVKTMK